jgi:hypothetical protein
MSILKRLFVTLAVSLVCCSVWADPPYGQSQDLAFGNWKLWCKINIPGVTADGKFVTGTNVLAECSVGMTTPSSGSPVYQFMQVKWVQLQVSGANANGPVNFSKDWTYPDHLFTPPAPEMPQGPGGTQGLIEGNPPDFRFSSAKFTHLSEITLTLTVKFKGWREVEGVLVGTESDPISVTIKPKAYNFFLGWRTTKTSSGGNWSGSAQDIIDATQSGINNMFVGHANHGYYTADPPYSQLTWLRDAILGKLDEATAVGPNTHGFPTGLADSVTWAVTQSGFLPWVDISGALASRAFPELPSACNLVLLYACDTLNGNDPGTPFGTTVASRATAGFDKEVWTHGLTNQDALFTLDKHVLALRRELVAGRSLGAALTSINAIYRTGRFDYDSNGDPVMSSFEESPMAVSTSSDGMATLIHVYLTSSERTALAINGRYPYWYLVLGAPPQ